MQESYNDPLPSKKRKSMVSHDKNFMPDLEECLMLRGNRIL